MIYATRFLLGEERRVAGVIPGATGRGTKSRLRDERAKRRIPGENRIFINNGRGYRWIAARR